MNIISSPRGIIRIEHPRQGVADMKHAGFTDILLDTSISCSAHELENKEKSRYIENSRGRVLVTEKPEQMENRLKPMLERLHKEQLHVTVGYAPYLFVNTKLSEQKEQLTQLTEESIRLCGRSGCQYIVIRPWFAGIRAEDAWKVNREYYLHFAELAKEYGMMILLENQCRDVNGHLQRGICADEIEAASWIDRLNAEVSEERFGFCMDVGTCNICGQNMYDFAVTLGNRIKAVTVRDCDGNSDTALLPFTCVEKGQDQTDWLNLIRGLRKIQFNGELILNFSDTAAAFSPILRPSLLQLARSVADYFKWQLEMESFLQKYDSVVLFGAGNMCRNYMKCYGEQYPPLFTCDNNSALWGTVFCGLEVKSPESLKELPENCVVMICNIYYREIEAQLKDLGIRNAITFFNDEYMPSFYFNRLDTEEG